MKIEYDDRGSSNMTKLSQIDRIHVLVKGNEFEPFLGPQGGGVQKAFNLCVCLDIFVNTGWFL